MEHDLYVLHLDETVAPNFFQRFWGHNISLLLLAGITAASAADFPPNPLEKPGWMLDAHDEFDGPLLNTNFWSPYYLESRTEKERAAAHYEFRQGTLVLYVDGNSKGYFKDGAEVMTVSGIQTGDRTRLHKDSDPVHHEIPVKMNYTPLYGYFEMRAKLPPGAQAAFWTVGTKDTPAHAGEIDIFESIKNKPKRLKYVLHTWGDKSLAYQHQEPELDFDSTQEFHVYALEWKEQECVLFIDNRRVMSMPQAPNYPGIFLLTLYGNTRDSSKQEFIIDYFRAYKRKGQSLTPGAGAFR